MLKIENLHVSVDNKDLLRDINFQLDSGSYLCVLGANGAGKSTLIKAIMGITAVSSGTISFNDTNLLTQQQKQRARYMSYLCQSTTHSIQFSVTEFIKMARYPYHQGFAEWSHADQKSYDEAIAITDTEQFLKRRIETLSGGERQRVMIAAAVCQDTPLLLLDEPSSFLDPFHQIEVQNLIKNLHRHHHKTIIEVTHDLNHAVQNSQQILALKQGHCLWHGQAADLLQSPELEQIYGQEFVISQHPQTGKPIALSRVHH